MSLEHKYVPLKVVFVVIVKNSSSPPTVGQLSAGWQITNSWPIVGGGSCSSQLPYLSVWKRDESFRAFKLWKKN